MNMELKNERRKVGFYCGGERYGEVWVLRPAVDAMNRLGIKNMLSLGPRVEGDRGKRCLRKMLKGEGK